MMANNSGEQLIQNKTIKIDQGNSVSRKFETIGLGHISKIPNSQKSTLIGLQRNKVFASVPHTGPPVHTNKYQPILSGHPPLEHHLEQTFELDDVPENDTVNYVPDSK